MKVLNHFDDYYGNPYYVCIINAYTRESFTSILLFWWIRSFLRHRYTSLQMMYELAGKPAFGGLPCFGALTMALRRLSADASMLCDGELMSAGQYVGICNVMCAWDVSMQGGALSRLYH